jgi:lambda repressor-like predicted transcriptional regulator
MTDITPNNQKNIPLDNSHQIYDFMKAEPVEPGIHYLFIKAALARAGYSQKRVAKELKIAPPTVNNIIKGKGKSLRIAEFIASKTGLTLEQMWPGQYEREDTEKTD